ncbi:MAG: hypothetical protein E3J67_03980 [Dehalococcoidia bacterium]|nr:MAG: hypothetical protein E3J67_03980 [Dehalococcoidia bacterium]
MNVRLILAIFSTLLEEAAIVAIVLWGLPQLGIEIPVAGLIALMVVWAGFSIFTYRLGSRALKRKVMVGLPTMVGSRGKAASPLAPDGFIKIKGELWEARSSSGKIDSGEKVIVLGQDGLKLVVGRAGIDKIESS